MILVLNWIETIELSKRDWIKSGNCDDFVNEVLYLWVINVYSMPWCESEVRKLFIQGCDVMVLEKFYMYSHYFRKSNELISKIISRRLKNKKKKTINKSHCLWKYDETHSHSIRSSILKVNQFDDDFFFKKKYWMSFLSKTFYFVQCEREEQRDDVEKVKKEVLRWCLRHDIKTFWNVVFWCRWGWEWCQGRGSRAGGEHDKVENKWLARDSSWIIPLTQFTQNCLRNRKLTWFWLFWGIQKVAGMNQLE
jgi:hypothetical protein